MGKDTKATVSVVLTCTIDIPITDSGYLGADATVAEHIKKAESDLRSYTFLLKRGGREPEPVAMNAVVKGIVITPQEA